MDHLKSSSGMRGSPLLPRRLLYQVRIFIVHPRAGVCQRHEWTIIGRSIMAMSCMCIPHAGSGAALQLRDTAMLRMLLYPPSSALAFLPAAYQQPLETASAAILISNCSIVTLCQTVAMYTSYLKAKTPESVAVSTGTVDQQQNKYGPAGVSVAESSKGARTAECMHACMSTSHCTYVVAWGACMHEHLSLYLPTCMGCVHVLPI